VALVSPEAISKSPVALTYCRIVGFCVRISGRYDFELRLASFDTAVLRNQALLYACT